MSRDDWYRNETWDEAIEAAFYAKLKRARAYNRPQYVRIQAVILASLRPDIALRLLDEYFALGQETFYSLAFDTRAEAYLALGQIDEAVAAYDDALRREAEFPNVLTSAYVDLPFLVATRRLEDRYESALQILATHAERPTFPVQHFLWHAAYSIISRQLDDLPTAADHAKLAQSYAELDHSGFRYHKSLGLVGDQNAEVIDELSSIARLG